MIKLKDIDFTRSKYKRGKVLDGVYFDNWKVSLEYKGKSFTTDFLMGTGCEGKPPNKESVMESLQSDCLLEQDSFEEFCHCLAYSSDSIKAHKIYKDLVMQTTKLKRFFEEHFDDFLDFNFEGGI